VVTTPLSKRPPTGQKFVLLSNGVSITQTIAEGMKEGAAALGWDFKVITYDQNNPATIASSMLAAASQGANAIAITATDVSLWKSALAVAKQHHVSIIDVSSGNVPAPGITARVNNASENGPTWGKLLALGGIVGAEKDGKQMNALLLTTPIFSSILGATDVAVKANVAQYCPACQLSTLPISGTDLFAGHAAKQAVSYLQSHPKVTTILQDQSLTDTGLAAALSAAGFSSIKIYGLAPVKAQIDELKKGSEAGWVIDPLHTLGWMAIDAAARASVGDDATVYGSVSIPAYFMTQATTDGPVNVPADFADQFKKLWGLS
jgi:ABC-type sugar transport system substrate-binding protein